MPDPIALGVPFFFLLIGIEYAWAKRRQVTVYRFGDALTNLSCGITSQMAVLFWGAVQLAIYAWVFGHVHLITYSRWWTPWLVAFVGVDLLYYWWHRLSHEVNVLWAAHVVHHQSEDYNLAVALRQAVLTGWTVLPFYLPLALVGVPPLVYAVTVALSTLYQFWIHTRLVGKVRGPLDWILNLPSHHRVHHAINEEYLDKNYGATLVVWDRLFGTYAEEIAEPVYGITTPLGSFHPLWAQVHYWLELGRRTRTAPGPYEKLAVWFRSPAWKPEGYVASAQALEGRHKYEGTPLSKRLAWYVALQYVVVIGVAFSLMMWHGYLTFPVLVVAAAAVVAATVSIGGLLEGRAWARRTEVGRLLASAAAIVVFASLGGCRHEKKAITLTRAEGPSTVLPGPARDATTATTRATAQSLVVDGRKRTYLLVEPQAASATPTKHYPLVFVLHGDGGDAASFHEGFPFERASGSGAYLVYPDGIGQTWDLDSKIDNRDVHMLEQVLADLVKRFAIDKDRVFGAGYSSGGFLANVMACQRSGFFRAISSSAGGAPYQQAMVYPNGFTKCPGEEPTAALVLHGESDQGVTLDSGRFDAEYWAYVNGCQGDQMETTFYDECHAYRGCPAGKAVAWCQIPALGHWVWARAAEASWTFFRQVAP